LLCIAQCPEKVKQLQQTFAAQFPAQPISIVTGAFMADESCLIKNDKCSTAITATLDAIDAALQDIATIEQYVQLSIPIVEDGGNFGVSIQLAAIKILNDQSEKLDKCIEDLMKYTSARADALEKCKLPSSTSTKTSTATSSESAGTEKEKGETASNTKSQSTEEKAIETISNAAESTLRKQSVIAVDVRYYEKAKYTFKAVMTSILVVADFMEKNKLKIAKPRDEGNSRGYSGSMY
jgi:Proteasome activator pa28 beta subunit